MPLSAIFHLHHASLWWKESEKITDLSQVTDKLWLPLWYLQTFSMNKYQINMSMNISIHSSTKIDTRVNKWNHSQPYPCSLFTFIKYVLASRSWGQTKYYNISICCFYEKRAVLRRKSKDWLALNRENMFEWGSMSTRGLLCRWASTIKIQLNVLV